MSKQRKFSYESYICYKHITNRFISLLFRACGERGIAVPTEAKSVSLKTLNELVDLFCESAKDSKHLISIVSHCKKALHLRLEVSAFFEELVGYTGNDVEIASRNNSHKFFNDSLRIWLDKLSSALMGGCGVPLRDVPEVTIGTSMHTHEREENIFSHLEVDMDDGDNGNDKAANEKAPDISITSNAPVEHVVAEDFYMEDLKLLTISFLYDAELLMNDIRNVWERVKKQETSVLAASAFTVAALKQISSLFAVITLHYPDIVTFEDFWLGCVVSLIPDEEDEDLFMKKSDEQARLGSGRFALPSYLKIMMSNISSFTTAYKCDQPRTMLCLRRGYFGDPFDENTSPLQGVGSAVSDRSGRGQTILSHPLQDSFRLIVQEVPYMYNNYIHYMEKGTQNQHPIRMCPMMSFLTKGFFAMFETKAISTDLIMCCVAWAISVQVMQGDHFIARTNYLLREKLREMTKRGKEAIEKGIIQMADRKLCDKVKEARLDVVKYWLDDDGYFDYVFRNPLFSGACFLDMQLTNLHLGELVLTSTSSHYRAVCHIYNALRLKSLIAPIPILDHLISNFDYSIFTPCRPCLEDAGSMRSLFNTYLLSSHLTAATVHALNRGSAMPKGRQAKVRKGFNVITRSAIFRAVVQGSRGYSSTSLSLDEFLRTFHQETVQSKLINIDLLSLNAIFYDLFTSLRDELNRVEAYNFILANEFTDQSDSYRHTMALEMCTSYEILKLLDTIDDGNRQIPAIIIRTAHIMYDKLSAKDDGFMSRICFTHLSDMREVYCSRFGTRFVEKTRGRNEKLDSSKFGDIMDILEDATGPLTEETLEYVKDLIRECPNVLGKMSPCDELESIFHHFIGNPLLRNDDMAAWICAMGGGEFFCFITPEQLCVMKNNVFALRLRLRTTEGILTPDRDTGNTLMHLAAEAGNIEVISLINRYNPRWNTRNKRGELPIALSKDDKVRQEIARLASASTSQHERADQTDVYEEDEKMRRSIASNHDKLMQRTQVLNQKLEARRKNAAASANATSGRVDNEAIARAQKAEAELLALLDSEEQSAKKTNKKSSSKKKNNKKK